MEEAFLYTFLSFYLVELEYHKFFIYRTRSILIKQYYNGLQRIKQVIALQLYNKKVKT